MSLTKKQEFNKRCAEFLEWKIDDLPIGLGGGKGWFFDNVYQCELGLEMFHEDWNILIEVVKAVKSTSLLKKIGQDFWYDWKVVIDKALITLDKKEVIKVLSEFLIWYEKFIN